MAPGDGCGFGRGGAIGGRHRAVVWRARTLPPSIVDTWWAVVRYPIVCTQCVQVDLIVTVGQRTEVEVSLCMQYGPETQSEREGAMNSSGVQRGARGLTATAVSLLLVLTGCAKIDNPQPQQQSGSDVDSKAVKAGGT